MNMGYNSKTSSFSLLILEINNVLGFFFCVGERKAEESKERVKIKSLFRFLLGDS